jgi:hypothetical protein
VDQDEDMFFNEDREFVKRLRFKHSIKNSLKTSIEIRENQSNITDPGITEVKNKF